MDEELIKENLRPVKERGHATDECQTHEDLNCITVTIRDGTGDVIGAMNFHGSLDRMENLGRRRAYDSKDKFFISRN